ncbi:hypothetical protein PJF56_14040 [Roseofilum sp. BLCC_M91]|uniref:DUF29 domain-containing protein n=1 Tax=Roseofilum halophilum BLCC-M91 TaxID=3022259 RepID=A0ABT7BLB0_9CYAN|nr:hypothetical protein [Roseofilum halophilum]MDJ1179985.1 hypothetical protein [Roseofilum halophilum BLCC-M91]
MEPQVKPQPTLLYDPDYQLWLNDTVNNFCSEIELILQDSLSLPR